MSQPTLPPVNTPLNGNEKVRMDQGGKARLGLVSQIAAYVLSLVPTPLKGDKGDKGDAGKDSTVPGPPGKDSVVPGPPGKDSTVPGPPGDTRIKFSKRVQTTAAGALTVTWAAGNFDKGVVPVVGIYPEGDANFVYSYRLAHTIDANGYSVGVTATVKRGSLLVLGLFTDPGVIWCGVDAKVPVT